MDNVPERLPSSPRKIEGHFYTQVNVQFPSEQVELPPAEKFNAFSPEAQKAILAAFEKEQTQRHAWLKNQQAIDHSLNTQKVRYVFWWRLNGTFCGTIIVLSTIGLGAWLVKGGASAVGVSMMIGATGGLIIAAIYGHTSNGHQPEEQDSNQESGQESNTTKK